MKGSNRRGAEVAEVTTEKGGEFHSQTQRSLCDLRVSAVRSSPTKEVSR